MEDTQRVGIKPRMLLQHTLPLSSDYRKKRIDQLWQVHVPLLSADICEINPPSIGVWSKITHLDGIKSSRVSGIIPTQMGGVDE